MVQQQPLLIAAEHGRGPQQVGEDHELGVVDANRLGCSHAALRDVLPATLLSEQKINEVRVLNRLY